MQPNMTTIERAFELARSGRYLSLSEIKVRLSIEGYSADFVEGPQLCSQLKALIKTARTPTRLYQGTRA
jgi:hypothetical protein